MQSQLFGIHRALQHLYWSIDTGARYGCPLTSRTCCMQLCAQRMGTSSPTRSPTSWSRTNAATAASRALLPIRSSKQTPTPRVLCETTCSLRPTARAAPCQLGVTSGTGIGPVDLVQRMATDIQSKKQCKSRWQSAAAATSSCCHMLLVPCFVHAQAQHSTSETAHLRWECQSVADSPICLKFACEWCRCGGGPCQHLPAL